MSSNMVDQPPMINSMNLMATSSMMPLYHHPQCCHMLMSAVPSVLLALSPDEPEFRKPMMNLVISYAQPTSHKQPQPTGESPQSL